MRRDAAIRCKELLDECPVDEAMMGCILMSADLEFFLLVFIKHHWSLVSLGKAVPQQLLTHQFALHFLVAEAAGISTLACAGAVVTLVWVQPV
jgi:hypothetical protein